MAIEVLVGVVMLGLVLVVSYMALERIGNERCKQDMAGAFQTLGIAINDVLTSGTGRELSVRFDIPACFEPSRSVLLIGERSGQDCVFSCKRNVNVCSLLTFTSFDLTEDPPRERVLPPYCLDAYLDQNSVEPCPPSTTDNLTGAFFPFGGRDRDSNYRFRPNNNFTIKRTIEGLCMQRR